MAKTMEECSSKRQVLYLFATEIIVIVFMGLFTAYGPEASINVNKTSSANILQKDESSVYPSPRGREDILVRYSLVQLKGSFQAMTTGLVLSIALCFLQGFVICGFIATFEYAPEANASERGNSFMGYSNEKPTSLAPLYQDVHVMIWIGFGFLMTFPKRYGQSAIGFTFLVAAILLQVALLFDGVLNINKNGKVPLSLNGLLNADVAVAAPLISMGALLGKTTYMQLIFMGIIELAVYTVNKYIGEHCFKAVDAGGSMFVHIFGAYFGLAVSFAFGMKTRPTEHHLEGSSYQSDIFAMLGTIFLWLFWPSFNSALLQGDDQQRAIINTLLAIAGSCVVSFAVSALVSKEHKFNMVHIQNSTLAGGVAIGTAAGMMCQPVGALIIGSFSGIISVLGYKYVTPMIQKHLKIHDTCGVHNLHGMPGVIAGLFGAFMAGIASEDVYHDSLYQIFPARAPCSGTKLAELQVSLGIDAGLDRTAGQQAGYQFLALVVTLANALTFGIITGMVLRINVCGKVTEAEKFDDALHWELPDDIDDITMPKSRENHPVRVVEQVPMSHI